MRAAILITILSALAGLPSSLHAQDEADRAWTTGDVATARRLYSARLATDSTDERALHRMALMEAWDGHHAAGLRLFDRLLALGPNLEAEVDRARVLAWQGTPDRAVAALDTLLARTPGYIPALEARAEFLAWAGESEQAVESYTQLAEILPENRSVRSARARLLSWAARLDESIALYDSLVRTDPGDRDARLGLARVLGWAGRLREAEHLWHRALAQDSTHVPALVGLAQTLRWEGRDAAADAVLRRAEVLEATSQDVRTQRRWLNAVLRPRAGSAFTYESDSDGSGILTLSVRGGHRIGTRVDLRPYAYLRWLDLESGGFSLSRRAWGGGLEARTQLDPGWTVGASLGAAASTAATVGTKLRWGATATSPGWWRVVGTLGVMHEPLDVTAQLVENGVTITQAALDLRATPMGGWTATATVSLTDFQGSESNQRVAGGVGATHRLLRTLSVGGNVRTFGFAKDLGDGYFDPSFYLLVEVPARWEQEFARWTPSLEAAPGLQKISGAPLSAAIRVAGGIRYAVTPGREIALTGGYSTLGLSLFAEGGGGYRYRYVSLAGGWWF